MKLRLIMRLGVADYDGKLAGYEYKTYIVEVDEKIFNDPRNPPEIIGGEWLTDKEE